MLAILAPASAAQGQLWSIFVDETGGMGIPSETIQGDDIVTMVNDLVNGVGAFAAFNGQQVTGTVSFAGIPNVITVTVDPGTTTATLQFTILGAGAQVFVFNGVDLADQIEQFILDNLGQQVSAFLSQINQLSLIAVTDGSPMSNTARSAEYVFDRFGLHGDLTGAERRLLIAETEFRPGLRGRVDTYGDRISTDVGDGTSLSIVTSVEYAFDRTTSLALMFPINYTEIEGSDIINGQATIALPITPLRPDERSPWGVRVVPFATISGAGSADLIAGGLLAGGGLLTTVMLDFESVTLSATAQLSSHEGIVLKYQDFEFDPGVHQQLFKGGAKVTFRHGENLYFYGSIVFSSFVESAAVDQWWSPGVGVGFRTDNNFSITVGYSGDIADGYRSDGLRAMFQLPF